MKIYRVTYQSEGRYDLAVAVVAETTDDAAKIALGKHDELLAIEVIGNASPNQKARILAKEFP